MRILWKLASISPLVVLAACETYEGSEPTYRGTTSSGGQVISSPRTTSTNPVYSGSGSVSSGSSTTSPASDSSLVSDIRRAIGQDQALANTATQVQVTARNGVVTLSGSVPDQQTRESLIAVVRGTPGVVRITDQMYVGVSPLFQSQTQNQNAPVFQSSSGSSSTTEAESATGSASGASGQIFSMQVGSLTDTDRNLAQQILQGLRTDTDLTDLLPKVNINVSEGRVILQGHVQNDEQRRRIEEVVRRAAGTSQVENRLQLKQ